MLSKLSVDEIEKIARSKPFAEGLTSGVYESTPKHRPGWIREKDGGMLQKAAQLILVYRYLMTLDAARAF